MKKMKYIVVLLFIGLTSAPHFGCKDFLNVRPLDDLSGNNFWTDENDVESFTRGIYNQLRGALTSSMFFGATGDFRCSPVLASGRSDTEMGFMFLLKFNSLNALTSGGQWNDDNSFNFDALTSWKNLYEVIQLANIAVKQIDEVEDEGFTTQERARYKGEAVFLRNLSYFLLVRMYGDVPYYTNAFNKEPLSRTNMIEVIKMCLEDMKSAKENLPWKYEDPSFRAVRATKGSALALMMNLNMWCASFEAESNKAVYYAETLKLGDELLANPGVHDLLPIAQYKEVFGGKSIESLFEIPQSANYNESFKPYAIVGPWFLKYPNLAPSSTFQYSALYYDKDYLDILYPVGGGEDLRKKLWFDENMYRTDGNFQFLKYLNTYTSTDGDETRLDDNQIIFRLPGLILLEANAAALAGNTAKAIELVNKVRVRAGAETIQGMVGKQLLDFIFYERQRELMGEGHYFYDMVRTRRILDPEYTDFPINVEDFRAGAWTWPISPAAMTNNPEMTLNDYWR